MATQAQMPRSPGHVRSTIGPQAPDWKSATDPDAKLASMNDGTSLS